MERVTERRETLTESWSRTLRAEIIRKTLCVDEEIILKSILKKRDYELSFGCVWLVIRTRGGLL
jgi:hypothetical protein